LGAPVRAGGASTGNAAAGRSFTPCERPSRGRETAPTSARSHMDETLRSHMDGIRPSHISGTPHYELPQALDGIPHNQDRDRQTNADDNHQQNKPAFTSSNHKTRSTPTLTTRSSFAPTTNHNSTLDRDIAQTAASRRLRASRSPTTRRSRSQGSSLCVGTNDLSSQQLERFSDRRRARTRAARQGVPTLRLHERHEQSEPSAGAKPAAPKPTS
jgi:hypothetical protein